MVTTARRGDMAAARQLRNQGRADGGGWLDHARLGFNYRIDDIRAALGIGQLEKLDRILALRRLRSPRGTASCSPASTGSRSRWPTTPTTCAPGSSTSSSSPRGADRERVIAELGGEGIATRGTCRRSISSRTCASATASPRGSAR